MNFLDEYYKQVSYNYNCSFLKNYLCEQALLVDISKYKDFDSISYHIDIGENIMEEKVIGPWERLLNKFKEEFSGYNTLHKDFDKLSFEERENECMKGLYFNIGIYVKNPPMLDESTKYEDCPEGYVDVVTDYSRLNDLDPNNTGERLSPHVSAIEVDVDPGYHHIYGSISYEYLKIFNENKEKWKKDTLLTSNMSEIVYHPSYLRIIGLGPVILPEIFKSLEKDRGHWFLALMSITGEDPLRGNFGLPHDDMVKIWLEWGKQRGYVEVG